jgi:hypothetical protein
LHTVYPQIVSAKTILFFIWRHREGRKLFADIEYACAIENGGFEKLCEFSIQNPKQKNLNPHENH